MIPNLARGSLQIFVFSSSAETCVRENLLNPGCIQTNSVMCAALGREGQEAMNPVENLRTLWSGLRTPWKVSEPRGGGFLKKT